MAYDLCMQPDEEIIASYVRGDHDAFALLVERHLTSVYGFALRLTGNSSDAEDIAQESFMKAWKHIARFEPQKARFKTWLMQIVRNTAIDHLRKGGTVSLSIDEDDDGGRDVGDILTDDAPLPDEIAARAEDAAMLEASLQLILPSYREIVLLYNDNNLTFEEVALVLGIPMNTAKSRYRRALEALRKVVVHQK